MRNLLVAAGVAALSMAMASQASATVPTFFSVPGAASPSAGYHVIDNFDNLDGLTTTGSVEIKTPPADGDGAPPANSVPSGTPYLSVLGGGSATYTFAQPVSSFEFDWGSIDSYNTLVVTTNDGFVGEITGSNVVDPANGNQTEADTNRLFVANGQGALFTSFTISSSENSFEIDNLAVPNAVPEPATWAVMLTGFGAVGAAMRRRRAALA
jgi:hypothetical protein